MLLRGRKPKRLETTVLMDLWCSDILWIRLFLTVWITCPNLWDFLGESKTLLESEKVCLHWLYTQSINFSLTKKPVVVLKYLMNTSWMKTLWESLTLGFSPWLGSYERVWWWILPVRWWWWWDALGHLSKFDLQLTTGVGLSKVINNLFSFVFVYIFSFWKKKWMLYVFSVFSTFLAFNVKTKPMTSS